MQAVPNLSVGDFHYVCGIVIDKSNQPSAIVYAKAGLKMNDIDEIATQALYIRSNLQHWRGEVARVTKEVLKGFE